MKEKNVKPIHPLKDGKMKNKQLSILLQGALACQDAKGLKFAYALQKNIRLMKQEIKRIFDLMMPSEEYAEYDREREQLAHKHAKKDKKGKVVIKDEKYVIADQKKFEKELKALQKKYEKPFAEQAAKEATFNDMLDQECTIKFHKIEEKSLPDNISTRQLDIISSFMFDAPDSEKDTKTKTETKS